METLYRLSYRGQSTFKTTARMEDPPNFGVVLGPFLWCGGGYAADARPGWLQALAAGWLLVLIWGRPGYASGSGLAFVWGWGCSGESGTKLTPDWYLK